jgi:hypothetical protein
MALTHVSDTYKAISESLQSVMNCIFTSVTHDDVHFKVDPFSVHTFPLAFLPMLQALLHLTIAVTYIVSDWS